MAQNKKQSDANLAGSNVNTTQSDFKINTSATSTGTLKLDFANFKYYEIDFDKVNSLEDIKALLKASRLCFSKQAEGFNDVKHLLKDVD